MDFLYGKWSEGEEVRGREEILGQAEKMLAELMAQIHHGEYSELEKITFEEFAKKWLKDYVEPRIKVNTLRFYGGIKRLHLIPHFGEFKLTAIKPHIVEEYLAKTRRETKLSGSSLGYPLPIQMRPLWSSQTVWES